MDSERFWALASAVVRLGLMGLSLWNEEAWLGVEIGLPVCGYKQGWGFLALKVQVLEKYVFNGLSCRFLWVPTHLL